MCAARALERGRTLRVAYHRRVTTNGASSRWLRRWLSALAVFAALFALAASTSAADAPGASGAPVIGPRSPGVIVSAGSMEHGWFADENQRGFPFPSVYHMPPGLEPGSVRTGPRIADTPAALAAWGQRLVIVLREERIDLPSPRERAVEGEATPQRGDQARLIRRVLTVTTRPGPATGMWEYSPRGRDPIAMPSLPGRGHLRGVAMTGDAMVALLSGDDEDRLLALPTNGRAWEDAGLPEGWSHGAPAFLVGAQDRVVLAQRGHSGGVAWRSAGVGDPLSWERESIGLAADDRALVFAGGSLVAASVDDKGRVALHLLRMGERHLLAAIEHEVERYAVVGTGDSVVLVWRGGSEPLRLRTTVYSAVTGALLYDGPARTSAVVSGREIQSLALLAGALMLTILIFVLRPEDAVNAVITLPPGTRCVALAPAAVGADRPRDPDGGSAAVMGVSGRELFAAAVLSDSATTARRWRWVSRFC